jgi:hypothetical protein
MLLSETHEGTGYRPFEDILVIAPRILTTRTMMVIPTDAFFWNSTKPWGDAGALVPSPIGMLWKQFGTRRKKQFRTLGSLDHMLGLLVSGLST